MHAKMTRDRKKCFIATIEKTIDDLERENNRMREILAKVSSTSAFPSVDSITIPTTAASKTVITPITSPELTGSDGPSWTDGGDENEQADGASSVISGQAAVAPECESRDSKDSNEERPCKRVAHGFTLDG